MRKMIMQMGIVALAGVFVLGAPAHSAKAEEKTIQIEANKTYEKDFLEMLDKNKDGYVSEQEAAAYKGKRSVYFYSDIQKLAKEMKLEGLTKFEVNRYDGDKNIFVNVPNVKELMVYSGGNFNSSDMTSLSSLEKLTFTGKTFDVEGLKELKNLKNIYINVNKSQKTLTIANLKAVETLEISGSTATDIVIKNCPKLKTVQIEEFKNIKFIKCNGVETVSVMSFKKSKGQDINFSNLKNLKSLSVRYDNKFKNSLDVSKNKKLEKLYTEGVNVKKFSSVNKIKELYILSDSSVDLSKLKNLKDLTISTQKKVDVSKLKNLKALAIKDASSYSDLRLNKKLKKLALKNVNIPSYISSLRIKELSIEADYTHKINSVNLSSLKNVKKVSVYADSPVDVNVSNCKKVQEVTIGYDSAYNTNAPIDINVMNNPNLKNFRLNLADSTLYANFNIKNNKKLDNIHIDHTVAKKIDFSNNSKKLVITYFGHKNGGKKYGKVKYIEDED